MNNETKKVQSSIARRFNRKWVTTLFSLFLSFDLLILSISFFGWCYLQETKTGERFHLNTARSFAQVKEEDKFSGYKEFDQTDTFFLYSPAITEKLHHTKYIYRIKGEKVKQVYAGRYLLFLYHFSVLILIGQGIILLINIFSGAGKAKKFLIPLDEMALKARVLANAATTDHTNFQNLETAINKLNPDAHLYTGNDELQGLESAINDLLDRMHKSHQQQARFVSDASHELRTPIAVIQGYANMLDRWGKEDETILDESINAIKSESDHMKNLVEQLLFLARGDSGRTKLEVETVSLTKLSKEVYDESVLIDAKHKYHLKENSKNIQISGDAAMIKQAVRILVDNAAKYTPENAEIQIGASESDGVVRFSVQDEGIGMSQNEVAQIFDRFFRSDPARSRDSGGTGLGLSIAKWIVDKHEGYFDVLSREDIGTRITICFPENKNVLL